MIPTEIIIFGATGDLAQHKLLPTLFGMSADGNLPAGTAITAIGRRPLDSAAFLEMARPHLEKHTAFSAERLQVFSDLLRYVRLDFDDSSAYGQLVPGEPRNLLFYLAVAPESFGHILTSLASHALNQEKEGAWVRVMIEKPFGHDQASSLELNEQLEACFTEGQIYRIDHYLGKETVQNILAFRFANGMFEQLWNARHIDHVQITVAEEAGIGTRAAYYDHTGATKDLIQNHILQLLAVLTMEEPAAFAYEELGHRAQEVLERVTVDPDGLAFGQYEEYLQEAGVSPHSRTDTYAMATLAIDCERWRGVPIYVRTGKKLAKRVSEISIQFKQTSSGLFTQLDPQKGPNVLTFRIQPDEGIALRLGVKTPRQNMQVQAVNMEFCYSMSFRTGLPDGYERLFSDVLAGDFSLALHPCTIVESWRIADQLVAAKGAMPLLSYAAGSWGPQAADDLIGASGRRWLAHESTVCNGITLAE